MSLRKQIYKATQSGALLQLFTTEQLKVWMSFENTLFRQGES